jgi:hypothetical protein
VVGFDLERLVDLDHRHARHPLQYLGRAALVLGRQVQDDHEGHAVFRRHVFEQAQQAGRPPAEAPMPTTGKGAGRA